VWPSSYPWMAKGFFQQRWSKKPGSHLKAFASETMQAVFSLIWGLSFVEGLFWVVFPYVPPSNLTTTLVQEPLVQILGQKSSNSDIERPTGPEACSSCDCAQNIMPVQWIVGPEPWNMVPEPQKLYNHCATGYRTCTAVSGALAWDFLALCSRIWRLCSKCLCSRIQFL
jgi:hypothetical protein